MARHEKRAVVDTTRELWSVEALRRADGRAVLRYRHEMGYELTAVAPRPLEELTDRELVRLLEDVRRQPPVSEMADAA